MGLDRYERYRKSSYKLFAEHFLSEHVRGLEKHVDEMAEYRKKNPVVFDTSWALPEKNDSAEVTAWKNSEIASANVMMANIHNVLRERGVLANSSNK